MEIIAEKIVFGGNSLGKIDGKNVFVPLAVPGERLEVEVEKSARDYDIARITKIVEPSPHRVPAPCEYYGKCGGCNMMHIHPDFQRELRRSVLRDVFARHGIDISSGIEIISGPDYGYRARFQLTDGGLSCRNSNEIVPVRHCLCAEKPVNDFLAASYGTRGKGRTHVFGSVFMRDAGGHQNVIISRAGDDKSAGTVRNPPSTKGRKYKFKENRRFSGTIFSLEHCAAVTLCKKDILFDVRGFFQSNLFVFEKTLEIIRSMLPGGANALDMYAGSGVISAFLAEKYGNVVMVEHNRDALVYAERNLAGLPHMSFGMSGEAWVRDCAASCPEFDVCVIDPPRSGMEEAVRDYLCRSGIPLVLSLSCDPATHARDCASLLRSGGYRLREILLLDFYPNTGHIESLAVLEKA